MKSISALILTVGSLALGTGAISAQQPVPATGGQRMYLAPTHVGDVPAATVEIPATGTPVPAVTVSHMHGHAEGIAVSEAPCACEACKACVKECVPKTKVVYEVRCKDFCVGKCSSLLCRIRGTCSCDEAKVRTKKVMVKFSVPDGATSKFVLNGGTTCGGESGSSVPGVNVPPVNRATPAAGGNPAVPNSGTGTQMDAKPTPGK